MGQQFWCILIRYYTWRSELLQLTSTNAHEALLGGGWVGSHTTVTVHPTSIRNKCHDSPILTKNSHDPPTLPPHTLSKPVKPHSHKTITAPPPPLSFNINFASQPTLSPTILLPTSSSTLRSHKFCKNPSSQFRLHNYALYIGYINTNINEFFALIWFCWVYKQIKFNLCF